MQCQTPAQRPVIVLHQLNVRLCKELVLLQRVYPFIALGPVYCYLRRQLPFPYKPLL